jgi:hypothetical protein
MTIIYTQIEPDFILTGETHDNGSFTSGIIRRHETKTRQIQNGNEDVIVGFDDEGLEIFESQPVFVSQTYSPWDELDHTLVTWLDVDAWQDEKDANDALLAFKDGRQALMNSAIVDANGFMFDADETAINRMNNAITATTNELDTFILQWSLADTGTGVMTSVTLADLKLAHSLAVLNMSSVWSI